MTGPFLLTWQSYIYIPRIATYLAYKYFRDIEYEAHCSYFRWIATPLMKKPASETLWWIRTISHSFWKFMNAYCHKIALDTGAKCLLNCRILLKMLKRRYETQILGREQYVTGQCGVITIMTLAARVKFKCSGLVGYSASLLNWLDTAKAQTTELFLSQDVRFTTSLSSARRVCFN